MQSFQSYLLFFWSSPMVTDDFFIEDEEDIDVNELLDCNCPTSCSCDVRDEEVGGDDVELAAPDVSLEEDDEEL